MEELKDIFVSHDIAVQLKEIGFDDLCIAYFNSTSTVPEYPYRYVKDYNKNSTESKNFITAPTYEQVFKWFRDKNYLSSVVSNFGSFYGYIEHTREAEAFATDKDYSSYEEAREQLILKLIDIYKNDKK